MKRSASFRQAASLIRTTNFFSKIGLPWRWEVDPCGFVDGICIDHGTILIDPAAHVGDVLHEAGHLATLPGQYRKLVFGDVAPVIAHMLATTNFDDPDAPAARAAIQVDDSTATAWAWAAGHFLGLDPMLVIREEAYGGRAAEIRQALELGHYLGINGLSAAGFCVAGARRAAETGRPAYPKLAFWLQRGFSPTPADEVSPDGSRVANFANEETVL